MILWNVSSEPQEGQYDGKIYHFAAGEKKEVEDVAIASHLLIWMKDYGIVRIPERATKDELIEAEKEALNAMKKKCNQILINFETVNAERVAMKLGREVPGIHVKKAVLRKNKIDERLKQLGEDDELLVEEALKGIKESERVDAQITKSVNSQISSVRVDTQQLKV